MDQFVVSRLSCHHQSDLRVIDTVTFPLAQAQRLTKVTGGPASISTEFDHQYIKNLSEFNTPCHPSQTEPPIDVTLSLNQNAAFSRFDATARQ